MTTNRRGFLSWVGGTSMFAFAGPPVVLRSHLENRAVHPPAVDEKFDVSWADRVQGRFRAVFDSPEISEGAALFRAMVWCDQYKASTARRDPRCRPCSSCGIRASIW